MLAQEAAVKSVWRAAVVGLVLSPIATGLGLIGIIAVGAVGMAMVPILGTFLAMLLLLASPLVFGVVSIHLVINAPFLVVPFGVAVGLWAWWRMRTRQRRHA